MRILQRLALKSKPSLITVICMDPHSPNKLFATKYCFLILGDEFLFLNHFFIFRFFLVILCYFVIINFYKNYVIIIIFLINFFFHENYFYFSCSGMFWHVPGFIDAHCQRTQLSNNKFINGIWGVTLDLA